MEENRRMVVNTDSLTKKDLTKRIKNGQSVIRMASDFGVSEATMGNILQEIKLTNPHPDNLYRYPDLSGWVGALTYPKCNDITEDEMLIGYVQPTMDELKDEELEIFNNLVVDTEIVGKPTLMEA